MAHARPYYVVRITSQLDPSVLKQMVAMDKYTCMNFE